MRIPTPASTASTNDSFESVLQQAEEVASEPTTPEAPAAEAAPAEPEVVEDQAAEAPPERDAATAGDDATADPMFVATPVVANQAAPAEPTETLRRGETERQATAGKGTGSPRTSSSEDLLAAIVQRGTKTPDAVPVPGMGVVTPIAAASAKVAEPRAVGGIGSASALRPNGASQAPAVAAGYRANGKVSAELLDQARDSVFKQILMKLTDGGGEMRVRLEPPDLGELDLHVLVEHGNQMNLRIAADRSEVAELLQRHLPELCSALQASGLQIADAQVQTRSDRGAGFTGNGAFAGGDSDLTDHDLVTASSAPLRGGWISAEGLDFWA